MQIYPKPRKFQYSCMINISYSTYSLKDVFVLPPGHLYYLSTEEA